MPVYEYECKSCGEKFEVNRSLNDVAEKEKCPKCGGSDTRRVYSTFGSCSSCSPNPPSRPFRFG